MSATAAPLRSIDVGAIRITYLPDGVGHFTYGVFSDSSDECWARHAEQTSDGRWVCSIGGFLVESADQKILVDLGFGKTNFEIPNFATFESGRLLDSLGEAGVAPDEIDTVVYTHMHGDHTGWTATGDSLTFDRARHVAGQGEVEYWLANADAPNSPAAQLSFAAHFDESKDGEHLAAGVQIVQLSGHTPGHQGVLVSSGADRAMILGDTLHCAAQVEETDLAFMYDIDPSRARECRDKILAEAENSAAVIGSGHFSGSVFGRVVTAQGRRYWSPLS